ncbi:hypothetical protein ACTXL8_13925 [Glutamicibacter arilaitensis]|uniref:hypothetical protein n=1 Tax=Glutamicibacter TaxID=1742989 RepID=UPI0012FEB6EF|nr:MULTISPECIES: hypothetical protein [Glutamicibacter]
MDYSLLNLVSDEMKTAHTLLCALFLLLALEETLHYQACEPGHSDTGDHYKCLEENFDCKVIFIHGFILARAVRELRHS